MDSLRINSVPLPLSGSVRICHAYRKRGRSEPFPLNSFLNCPSAGCSLKHRLHQIAAGLCCILPYYSFSGGMNPREILLCLQVLLKTASVISFDGDHESVGKLFGPVGWSVLDKPHDIARCLRLLEWIGNGLTRVYSDVDDVL